MKHKILTALLTMAVCTASFAPTAYMANVSVNLNGTPLEFDAKPFIEGDRTLVPVRKIFEAVGADVEWDAETRTAIAIRVKNGVPTFVTIQADSTEAFINTESKTLDVPAKIVNDRTFVPLRFVVEALGEKVEWDGDTYTVNITTAQ